MDKKVRKMTINLVWANVFSILLLIVMAVVAVAAWCLVWGNYEGSVRNNGVMPFQGGLFVLSLCLGIVVHELIHGITWAIFAKRGWKSISFGIMWKVLTPYCHCEDPMKVGPYIWGALMPLLVLGVVPMLLGLCIRSGWMMAFGVVFVASASGDILVAWKLRKEPSNNEVLDHPTEAGCLVYEE